MAMIGRRFGNNRKVIDALFAKAMQDAGYGYKGLDSAPGRIFAAGFSAGFREARDTQAERKSLIPVAL